MSWPLVKLCDVAPAKPSKNAFSKSEEVWTLNLDQVEADTGKVLGKIMAPVSEAGTSTHGFDERHVLYSKLRPYLNKVVLPDGRGLATTELVPMLPDPSRLDRKYLAYYLRSKSFVDWVSSQVAGAKMPRVSMQLFWQHEIPLPPLPEQKRIAAILDKADAIRRKRQQAIQLADDFLRAVFLHMFGDPVTNTKGWDVKRIEEVAAKDKYAIKAGPFGSALKKEDYVPEGYKIYGQEQVIRDDLEYGDYFINEEKYESLASCSVSEGDVLISLVGSFGKVSVVPKDYHPGIINPRLMKIRFNESCASPWYMKYLLTTKEMTRKIEGMSHGGTMGILNVGKIRDLEVINPPLNLQESFLKISTQVRSIKGRCELVAANPLFDSLSQKAFSGQL